MAQMFAKIPGMMQRKNIDESLLMAFCTIPTFISILTEAMVAARPGLNTAWKYAKSELRPPTPAEIPKGIAGMSGIVVRWGRQSWRQLTVKVSFPRETFLSLIREESMVRSVTNFNIRIFNCLYDTYCYGFFCRKRG